VPADEGVAHDSTITHERFFDFLEKEIQKVHSFTDKKVSHAPPRFPNPVHPGFLLK
jgi:hypothetical protein